MSALQPIPGLYQHIPKLREMAAWNREKAKAKDTLPVCAHEADLSAAEDEKHAEHLRQHAASNEEIINRIEILIHDLGNAAFYDSKHRRQAIVDLENASMRLRRELGDPTEIAKPKPPEGTIKPPIQRTY